MGYGAFVPCRCYLDGKTKPPPFEVLEFEDGLPTLSKAQYCSENFRAYEGWIESACQHPGMILAEEGIASASGMMSLRETVRRQGEGAFPSLKEHLPTSNGGEVASGLLPAFLSEVERLRTLGSLGERSSLVDVDRGDEVTQETAMISISPTHRFALETDSSWSTKAIARSSAAPVSYRLSSVPPPRRPLFSGT